VRILVEPSDYVLRNFGDMAMLQAAVRRLAEAWPDARIDVLTHDPERLATLCPAATPLSGRARDLWLRGRPVRGADRTDLRSSLRACVQYLRRGDRTASRIAGRAFRDQVASADLVLVTGMGGITDAFPDYATGVLETLKLALANGDRPVAMMGQGFGPLERADLRSLAADVLPRLHLIGLREQLASRPLLQQLGVAEDRIVVTGDDAIEMAHAHVTAAPPSAGAIGVNFRVASYSGADDARLSAVAASVRAAAGRAGGDVIPVPISSVPGEEDLDSIRRLAPVAEAELLRARGWTSPAQVVAQLNRCRLLVTGSYHAAVFALSVGVPTIGLAASRYYEDKFYGLADMFGAGCAVVDLSHSPAPGEQVAEYIDVFWETGPDLRPRLLSAAVAQIESGRNAYRRLAGLVAASPSPHHAGERAPLRRTAARRGSMIGAFRPGGR